MRKEKFKKSVIKFKYFKDYGQNFNIKSTPVRICNKKLKSYKKLLWYSWYFQNVYCIVTEYFKEGLMLQTVLLYEE